MTDPSPQLGHTARPPMQTDDSSDEAVSLAPLFRLLSAYRWVLALAVVSAVVVCGLLLVGLAAILPSERTGSIQFRVLFDGAADNRYPNGTTFSPAEIIATPVLSEVYRANDLKRFGLYEDFKDSMAVLRSSVALDMLAANYSARLADAKLTPVDRARLEEEFRKKREAITDPVYTLTIRRHERLNVMPPTLMEKVLNDTLVGWAKQADELTGVTRFDLPVFSRNILKKEILDKDFLMAADGLRVQARRAADLANKLMALPGASSIRSRKDETTLSDVSFDLADTLRNQIEPLVYLIQERGLTNDPQSMSQYLHGQVVELRLERDATRARIAGLQNALQGYMATKWTRPGEGSAGTGTSARSGQGGEIQMLIPQISDTFLDRIIAMSSQTQASDLEYRKRLTDRIIKEGEALFELERSTSYYEGLEKTVRAGSRDTSAAQEATIRTQLRSAFEALVVAVNRLITLYDEVSAQRLNPAAMLYAVSDPFTIKTQRAMTSSTAVLFLAFAALFTLVVAPVGCAIHQSKRRAVQGRSIRSL